MNRLKVIDFDYGCGGFTKGLEDTKKFRVTKNFSLNSNNLYCYNKTHHNDFIIDDSLTDDFDLVVFSPDLKKPSSKQKTLDMTEINNILIFVSMKKPENLIIITKREVFPFLQVSDKVCMINDTPHPSKDIFANFLADIGYKVYNFIMDGAGFGLPQHIYYNIYWASTNDVGDLNLKEGFGRFKQPYRTPKNLIGDLRDNSEISWHEPDYKKKNICSLIEPGSNAKKTSAVSVSQGYNRLENDKVFSHLGSDFYTVSSSFPSIHPYYDRPLTIREGARLFGLTDDFDWDNRLKNKVVASMIYDSFYPVLSTLMGLRLYKMLK